MLNDTPKGLLNAVRGIIKDSSEKFVKEAMEAREKTQLSKELGKMKPATEPKKETPAVSGSDSMAKKNMKEAKTHTVPKTEKEKKLAALADPKDKITHADVMVGRGVKKEEIEQTDEAMFPGTPEYEKKFGKAKQDMKTGETKAFSKGTVTKTSSGLRFSGKYGSIEDSPVSAQTKGRGRPKKMKEETEEIQELSKDTLKSYTDKAGAVAKNQLHYAMYGDPDDREEGEKAATAYQKRMKGINKARNKMDKMKEETDTPGNSEHQCAIHVKSEQFGEGKTLFSQHAEPDWEADGYISWYDVMFEHGIERVQTTDMEILVSESHMSHKKKKKM